MVIRTPPCKHRRVLLKDGMIVLTSLVAMRTVLYFALLLQASLKLGLDKAMLCHAKDEDERTTNGNADDTSGLNDSAEAKAKLALITGGSGNLALKTG